MINEKHLKNLPFLAGKLADISLTTEEQIWECLTKELAGYFRCAASTFFETDDKRKLLTAKIITGSLSEELLNLSFSYQGICGWCAMERRSVLVNDVKSDPRFTPKVDNATGFATQTVICAPVMHGNELYGILELINPAEGLFSDDDLRLTEFACLQTAMNTRIMKLERSIKQVTTQGESVLQNLSGGFIGVDLSANIMFLNPRARQILGLPDGEFIGKPVEALNPSCPVIAGILKNTLMSRTVQRRAEFQCPVAGITRKIGYSTLLMQDIGGNVAGIGITFQDIT